MLKANISINLTKVKDNASYISTSKKGEKWANLEINVKDMVDNYGQNITVKFSKPKDSQDTEPVWLGNGSTYFTDGVAPQTAKQLKEGGATTQPKAATPFPTTDTLNDVADDLPF
tara:strand:+ start:190 stop:534 length:345 start_codon:yes stop_codon:yes gene_type:complete